MLRLLPFACAATAAALIRPTLATRHGRSSKLFAQLAPGWLPAEDPASGQTYFYNPETGQSQWEPPSQWDPPQAAAAQRSFRAEVLWWVAPTVGSLTAGATEYVLGNGEEQILGRYDMAMENPYISRAQCLVRVAADGTASLDSLGKPPTAIRAPGGAWHLLRRGETYKMADGDQLALDSKNPEGTFSAVFTVYLQQAGFGERLPSAQEIRLQDLDSSGQQDCYYGDDYGQQRDGSAQALPRESGHL